MRVGRQAIRRWFSVWSLVGALLVLTALAFEQFLLLRDQMDEAVRRQLQEQLADRMLTWEDALHAELLGAVESAAVDPAAEWAFEVQLRGKRPYYSSVYVWTPRRDRRWRGKLEPEPARFLYPLPPPDELDGPLGPYTRNACLPIDDLAAQDPHGAAMGLVAGCAVEPRPVRLLAASRAAAILSDNGDDDAALTVLDGALDPDMTLRVGIQQGMDPFRLFMHRHQRAEVLDRLGRRDEAMDLLLHSGLEACELTAPEYAKVRGWLDFSVRKPLRAVGRGAAVARLSEAIARAERRFRAYEEIGQRIMPQPTLAVSQEPRFVFDQYGVNPFLLFYGLARNGEIGVALEVDQGLLIADFLAGLRRQRANIVVIDARGDFVAGARSGGAVAVQVPFTRTLTHLRVGLRQEAVDAQMALVDRQWRAPMVVALLASVLGGLAIWAQVRADREQTKLLERQREFTARVTHELKTPLAGIKVMAENLEAGAFGDDAQRSDMARSIVREADRLHRRVEEVLAASRERAVPQPKPFDPEEALLEAVDHWGPRLEQAGVRLEADLDATGQVLGDAASFRDAVGCLLDNALKYRDPAKTEARVWLTLREEDHHVIVEVSDNGLGVPAAMREAIFERFVRVEGPHRGLSGGHGLGLAQVRDIVDEHRGQVRCVEGIDGGARFVVRVPVAT